MSIHFPALKKKSLISGYTMIELIMVMAIVGALASVFLLNYPGSQRTARDTQRKSDLKQYQASLERFANASGGLYPSYRGGVDPSNDSFLCEDLFPDENPPCPGQSDPRDGENDCTGETCGYLYETDGSDGGAYDATQYVLSAPLESPLEESTPYFVVCSSGQTGFTNASGVNNTDGVCPL